MTRDQAIKQAQKRWGKKALVRAYESQSSPERRDKAATVREKAKAEIEAIEKEINERLNECDWYQRLTAQRRAARKELEESRAESCFHRFSVGQDVGIAFHVIGSGDTWEQAFAEADKKARS